MKKLYSTLIFILFIGFSFGQASVKSASDLTSLKDKGIGYITLPSNLTKEDVASFAKYYLLYFTVDFNESTKVATIKMVEKDERSRAIIVRFLAACEVQTINIAGEQVHRDQLFEKYLK
ncbi:MAG: hypothetical protein M9916_09445 [Crocinitomicaceae bacterium]|nr:hypothetical protein [Crocinitomicaceae bacterium]